MKIFWLLLAASLIFLSFNRHSKIGVFNYRSQIFADRAGYYVYLPSALIYHFDASAFPEDVDKKTGEGFQLDKATNKVVTKYSYGVSMLQSPFFLMAHLLAKPLGFENNGFSLIYHWALDLAAVCYLLLSFFFLYKVLRQNFNFRTSFITLTVLFAGTNLFYYSILDGSMSHIYSFFLFSVWILLMSFWKLFLKRTVIYGLLTGATAALILIVRPTNLLFLVTTLFLNRDFKERLRFQLQYKIFVPGIVMIIIFALPQLIYWKYLSGYWFVNTYQGETFSNWINPSIIEFLFAPNNGLIIYNPLVIILFFGLGVMVMQKRENAWLISFIILFLIYVSASWWVWSFGCGYSARTFTEYYSLLILPLAFLINYQKTKWQQYLFIILITLFCVYNLKMIYSYGGCWFGDGDWDWGQYLHWLRKWPA